MLVPGQFTILGLETSVRHICEALRERLDIQTFKEDCELWELC
jgi:hypothetical protein